MARPAGCAGVRLVGFGARELEHQGRQRAVLVAAAGAAEGIVVAAKALLLDQALELGAGDASVRRTPGACQDQMRPILGQRGAAISAPRGVVIS